MTWNVRLLAYKHEDEITLIAHEVFYDEAGAPNGHTKEPTTVRGETVEEILEYLDKVKTATEKPILWAGDRFPEEYKPT